MTRLLIVGSREFNDAEYFLTKVKDYVWEHGNPSHIITGKARGADTLGDLLADILRTEKIEKPAEWDVYGKSAGYIRNEVMGELCDYALIFWDGESKGTKNMIDILKKLNKPHEVFHYKSKQSRLFG